MRSIEERIEGPTAESWQPEKSGEKVIGVIEEISDRVGDYGPYKVVTLFNEKSNTAHSVAGFGAVLKNKFEALGDADLGRTLAIVFKGLRPAKKAGAKDYKDYDVFLGPAVPQPVAGVSSVAAAPTSSPFDDEEPF